MAAKTKKYSVFLLLAILLLSIAVLAYPVKAPISINTNADAVVLSNEGAGYAITALVNAGYGDYNLYQILRMMEQSSDPSLSGVIIPEFLNALAACPAGAQIFTAKLSDYNSLGTAIAISTDGVVQTVSIYGSSYEGAQGSSTLDTVVSGVNGSFRAVYNSSYSSTHNGFLTSWVISPGGGVTTTYRCFAILYAPSNANTTQTSVILSNEGPGYGITALINAGYGTMSPYATIITMRDSANPSIASITTDSFFAALSSCPASSEIFTTQLTDYSAATAIAISTDGSVQTVNVYGATYQGSAGSSTLDTDISGVGSFRAVYNSTSTPLTSWTNTSGGNTTTYNVMAILWNPTEPSPSPTPTPSPSPTPNPSSMPVGGKIVTIDMLSVLLSKYIAAIALLIIILVPLGLVLVMKRKSAKRCHN